MQLLLTEVAAYAAWSAVLFRLSTCYAYTFGEWTSGLPAVLGGLFARLFLSRVPDRRPIRHLQEPGEIPPRRRTFNRTAFERQRPTNRDLFIRKDVGVYTATGRLMKR